MLEEISTGTTKATEKKKMAEEKAKEIAEASKVIAVEKVRRLLDFYIMFIKGWIFI